MANYTCQNEPFNWTKTGSDPTNAEASLGLQGGMALPAEFVNQQWTKTKLAIDELQNKIEDGTIKSGDTIECTSNFTIGTDASVARTAILGASCNVADDVTNSLIVGDSISINTATDSSAFIGSNITATVEIWASLISGANNRVDGTCMLVGGLDNYCNNLGTSIGKYCKNTIPAKSAFSTGDLFVIGNGIMGGARSNAFRVTANGQVMGTQAYSASGADFAEMFEWEDGNPNDEDRRGLFVTLDGEKIRLATSDDDYIAGVVSATPTVVGDAQTDDWKGKYKVDVFGSKIMENDAWQLAEGFKEDENESYVSRTDRKEWDAIGLCGKLIAVDDGTCEVNGYCKPSINGIGTKADSGYRVMARIDDSHVKILLK